jgi:hypothetical protein
MTLCPIALAVGCKRCMAFRVCPLKGVIGDYQKEEESSAALNCCSKPQLSASKEELGSARGFEFTHATCTSCGAHWLQVYCVATSIPGFERVSDQDAKAMLAEHSVEEHKKIMQAWADQHL